MSYQIPFEIEASLNQGEIDRDLAASELIKRLKETNCSLPEYNIYPDQFEYDHNMIISCGDLNQWEIVLWSDGEVEPTTFYQGCLFDSYELNLREALLNPQLVMDQLRDLVISLCEQISFNEDVEVSFEDLTYDTKNGEWKL